MFIRTKVAKGHTYYQIVECVRDGDKIRQRVVASLGPGVCGEHGMEAPKPAHVLKEMSWQLRRVRRQRNKWPANYKADLKGLAKRLKRWDREIERLQQRVDVLTAVIKSGKLTKGN
jgi:hypothetical protein